MTILQLNPHWEVFIPKYGDAWAVALIDYGPNINGVFLVHLLSNNQFLYVDVTLCKAAENFAYGLTKKPE